MDAQSTRSSCLRKHKNNTDVAFEVLTVFYVKEKRVYKLKVRWWNIGQSHPPWCMSITQKITLTPEQWKEWEIYK